MLPSVRRHQPRDEAGLAAFLKRAQVVETIDSVGQSLLLEGARSLTVGPGTPLLHQGDDAGAIYYVASGLVGIEISGPPPAETTLVDLIWERGFFGAPKLQSSGRLPFGAIALEECQLLKVEGDRIVGVLQRCGHCARAALRLYENMLMRSVKLHRLRLGSVDARLQSFMELFGQVSHRLTRPQMAAIIGVSTASLYRALSTRQPAEDARNDTDPTHVDLRRRREVP